MTSVILLSYLDIFILIGVFLLVVGFLPLWFGLSSRSRLREWGQSNRRIGLLVMALGIMMISYLILGILVPSFFLIGSRFLGNPTLTIAV